VNGIDGPVGINFLKKGKSVDDGQEFTDIDCPLGNGPLWKYSAPDLGIHSSVFKDSGIAFTGSINRKAVGDRGFRMRGSVADNFLRLISPFLRYFSKSSCRPSLPSSV